MPVPVFTTGEVLTAANMNKVGLWKIASGDLSGNIFNLGSVFTTDFKDYRIIFSDIQASAVTASTALNFYLRTGTTNTTAGFYYGNNYLTFAGAPVSGTFGGTNNASWNITYCTNVATQPASMVFDLFSPQLAKPTQFAGMAVAPDSSRWGAGSHQASTSYDGFSLQIAGAGITMTGKYEIYGYRN